MTENNKPIGQSAEQSTELSIKNTHQYSSKTAKSAFVALLKSSVSICCALSPIVLTGLFLAAPLPSANALTFYGGKPVDPLNRDVNEAVNVANPGTELDILGGTITISTGSEKSGLEVSNKAVVRTAGDIVISGPDHWYGANATTNGKIIFNGSTIVAHNFSGRSAILASSNGLISGTVNVDLTGANTYGVEASSGGTIDLTGGSISTNGTRSYGVLAMTGQIKLTNVTITARGTLGMGILAYDRVEVIGGTVTAHGSSSGIVANAGGDITTSATVLTTGDDGYGIDAFRISSIKVTGGSVKTLGDYAYGVVARTGGNVTISGGTVTTEGNFSHGLLSLDSSSTEIASLTNYVNVTTSGTGAIGAFASGEALMDLNAGLIKTTGPQAHGVVSERASTVRLQGATFETQGNGSVGLIANGTGSTISGAANVTTTGDSAHTAQVSNNASLTLTSGVLKATGLNTTGLLMNSPNTATGRAGTASLSHVTLDVTGPSLTAINGVSNIALANSTATANNGVWLDVSNTNPTYPTIAHVDVNTSDIKGAALTAAGSAANVRLNNSEWDLTASSSLTTLNNNASTIRFSALAPADDPTQLASYKTLAVANYVGNGGTLVMNTYLDDTGSASDRLIITGSATGQSFLSIVNSGGLGVATQGNGILVVEAVGAATTAPGAFQLSRRVAAGGHEYRLVRGTFARNDANSWYLRSTFPLIPLIPPPILPGDLDSPESPTGPSVIEVPDYRVEFPLMTAVMPVAMEYGYTMLGTLHERTGETWITAKPAYEERTVWCKDPKTKFRCVARTPYSASSDQTKWTSSGWARVFGDRGFRDNNNFTRRGADYNYTFSGIQAGLDVYAREQADGTLDKLGIYVGYGQIDANVKGAWSGKAGSIDMDAYTLGAYWTHFAPSGWYTDAVVQGTWYSSDAKSTMGQKLKTDGFGILASLEAGYTFKLGNGFTLEPQAQLVYQNVSFDNVADAYGRFSLSGGESLRGRLGLRMTKTWNMADEAKPRLLTTWVRANVWHEFMGKTTTTATSLSGLHPVAVNSSLGGTWAEIGVGASGQVSDNVSVFATGGYNRSLDNKGREAWNGRLGLTVKW